MEHTDFMLEIIDADSLRLYVQRPTIDNHSASDSDSKLIIEDVLHGHIARMTTQTTSSESESDDSDSGHIPIDTIMVSRDQAMMFEAMDFPTSTAATTGFVNECSEMDQSVPGHDTFTDFASFELPARTKFIEILKLWLERTGDNNLWQTIKQKILLDPYKDTSTYDVQTWRNALDMWCAFLGYSKDDQLSFDPRKSAFNYEADGRPAKFVDTDGDAVSEMVGPLPRHLRFHLLAPQPLSAIHARDSARSVVLR